ncbi:hypothetical protein KMA67_00005 [Enterococcus durans]|uniref:hypothetical protein n=1 Tax=Enterococcus durans TaxID=53345 RepID=UPI001D0B0196|nr:hypothetical protein [Enterococcus durans]MCB8504113.1 hypothetical protein [Enterococcus durans]
MRIIFVKIDQGLEKLLDKKSWKVNEEYLLKILVIHLVFIGGECKIFCVNRKKEVPSVE